MAILVEEETYEVGIYQLEMTDPVQGGPNGIDNLQAKQLANRTKWLNLNKQDKDATLTAIAALITAADTMIYATGVDTFAMTTLSAFARTLLDDTDAATMRTTLNVEASGAYDSAHSFTTNGYQKFSNGLIVQWGTTTSFASNTDLTVTLPIAFPNAILNIQVQRADNTQTATMYSMAAIALSLSQIKIHNGTNTTLSPMWIAIGY